MDNTGQFKLNSKFLPRNDVIFSIMFADKELFSQLLTSVIGEPVDPIEVISQANITKENTEHNNIRLDTYAVEASGRSLSADMQNTYSQQYIENRTVYYACRLIARQKVENLQYENLKQVAVSFILTSKKNKQAPVEIVRMYRENDKEHIYSGLITIYNVFIPSVVRAEDNTVSESLKIFAHFFSINTQDDLNNFVQTYKNYPLASLLMLRYSEAVNRMDLDQIIGKEYFTMKSAEALKMEYLEKNKQADARLAQLDKDIAQLDKDIAERLEQADTRLAQADEKLVQADKKLVQADKKLVQADEKLAQANAEKNKLQESIKAFSDKIILIVKKLYVNSCPVDEISETVGISESDVRNILGLAN